MDKRRITHFVFGEHSYDLAAEDNSSVSVSQTTGLVSLEPGNGSLPSWCLSPDHIIGFESTEHSEEPGRSIHLFFVTEYGEQHRLYLGTTPKTGDAESWVVRVNSLYPRSSSLDRPGNSKLAQLAPLSGTPFLDESIASGKVTWVPGIYGNMIPRRGRYAPPKPYEPTWMTAFADRALQRAGEVTNQTRSLRLDRSASLGVDSDALMYTLDLVRPYGLRRNRINPSRAVLSGELLFEEPLHRPDLKILGLAEVTHLALLARTGGPLVRAIKRRELAMDTGERDASLADWLELVNRRCKKNRTIPIITHEKEISDFHLMDTLSGPQLEGNALRRFPAGSIESIAELLHRFEDDDAVLVCDVGTANELSMYYAYRYHGVRKGFKQLQPRYSQPVKAGLGLAAEDPIWCEICAQALNETIGQDSKSIQLSLKETKKRVENFLGMRWLAAAA